MDGQHYMERYIQEVVRRLPKGQRAEIALELQEMIQEMLSADGEEATVESVLLKLGPPKELAKKYRDDRRYLVSPEYFDNYLWVLRIVLLCVGLSVIFSAVVNFFLDPKQAKEAAMELLYLPVQSLEPQPAPAAAPKESSHQQIRHSSRLSFHCTVLHAFDLCAAGVQPVPVFGF